MFNKKKCPKCGNRVEEKYSFCPYCGGKMNSKGEEENWGLLGKDDVFPAMNEIKLPFGFNAIFNSVMKNMSKEFESELTKNIQESEGTPKRIKRDGISISISTFGNGQPKIKVTPLGNNQNIKVNEEKKVKIKDTLFTKEKSKEFSELKREEPKTNVKRLANKVVYELEMPGVKTIEDISIIKLENSIEVKAIAKDKAYTKVIPINLPIKGYDLSEGKLILELGIKN